MAGGTTRGGRRAHGLEELRAACAAKGIEPLCSEGDLERGLTRSTARFRCGRCSHEWEANAYEVARPAPGGSGCPECARLAIGAARAGGGESRFAEACAELGYGVAGPWRGYPNPVALVCPEHGGFEMSPEGIHDGRRCPGCPTDGRRRVTHLTPFRALTEACDRKQIEFLGTEADLSAGLVGSKGCRFRCRRCSHEWRAAAYSVARRPPKDTGCPRCAARTRGEGLRRDGESAAAGLCRELGYEALSPYAGSGGLLSLRCSADGEEFEVSPTNLRGGQRCPACSGNPRNRDPAEAVAAAIAGTTWEPQGGPPPRGGESLYRCGACGAGRRLAWASLLAAGRREDASRQCDCRRYGAPYEAYVAGVEGYELVGRYEGVNVPTAHRHAACGHVWMARPCGFRGDNGHPTRCPRCARAGRSSRGQVEMTEFVESLGALVEDNAPGLDPANPRGEVDALVTLPGGRRVALEFDGVWWHAEGGARDSGGRPRAAARPGEAARRMDALAGSGVQLVRVYSDEWARRRPAVESRLRAILGFPLEVLDARKLLLDASPDPGEVRDFVSSSHTQGSPPGSHECLALRRADGSLAAAMTFGGRTLGPSSARRLELLRFCCSPGARVRGGAGRLLAAYARAHPGEEITTFADLRWTPAWGSRMYESIGFRSEGRTAPTYDYVHRSDTNRRHSRLDFQKHKLLARHPEFDASMTEAQIAERLGYARLWNCGNIRYTMVTPG